MSQLVSFFLLALAFSLVLVPTCRRLAFRIDCVARPSQDRWHRQPTPLLGGAAIVVAVFAVSSIARLPSYLWLLLATAALTFVVGLVDDIWTLKPSTKLVAEIGVASILLFFGYRLHWLNSLTLDALLTLVWLVGVTNAFNLLDNMDGLCGGIAFIAAATLLVSLAPPLDVGETRLLAILLGALLGFLFFNVNPASIFMGDSGSLVLGLLLGALALRSGQAAEKSTVFSVLLAPVLVLLIPIFDTSLVTISRLLSGRRPSQGGRDHSSHRLVAIGLSERKAVAVLWTLAALAGAIGILIARTGAGPSTVIAALFVLAMVIFAVYLSHVRVYEDADRRPPLGPFTPFVVDFMYKRRVAEVILDVCLVCISYYSAYRLRFDADALSVYFRNFLDSLPVVVGVQMTAFFVVGVYRGVWRFFSLMDGVVAVKGVVAGTVGAELAVLYLFRFENYSRGVFVIYAALLVILLGGSRASFRLINEYARRRRQGGERFVIYGAGAGGTVAMRELLGDRQAGRMVGFVDDDPAKLGTRVQGYPVLSGFDGLLALIRTGAVDRVVLSTRQIPGARLQELEEACVGAGVALSRLTFHIEHLVAAS